MPEAVDCAEWGLTVPNAGSVLTLAKHINPRVTSSVLYEDLATAIDGGKDALGSCGAHGGQVGVVANMSNPLYGTKGYNDGGAKPEGIIIKLVKAPSS